MFGSDLPQINTALPDNPQIAATANAPTRRGGMFGGGFGNFLANFAMNYAAGMGNPAALQNLQSMQQRRQMAAQQQFEYDRMQQEQQLQFQRQMALEQWRAEHPNNDTVNDYNFIMQQLGPEAGKQFLQTKTNPIVMTPYGPMPYSQVNPGARPEIGAVIDDPRKAGGQTVAPSGNFPR